MDHFLAFAEITKGPISAQYVWHTPNLFEAHRAIKEKKISVMINYNEHSTKTEHSEASQEKFRQHRWPLNKKPAFHQKLEKCIHYYFLKWEWR